MLSLGELLDLGFNNFLVFSIWVYKDDVEVTKDGEWLGCGEKVRVGELVLLLEWWYMLIYLFGFFDCIFVFVVGDKGME